MKRDRCRAFAFVFTSTLLLAVSCESSAEWVHLKDSSVWDQVGVLFNFRLVQHQAEGKTFTFVIYCRTKNALPVAEAEGGQQELLAGKWFSVQAASVGDQVSDYACAKKYTKEERDQWLHSMANEPPMQQWNRVGEHRDFRLTLIKLPGQTNTEIWVVDCRARGAKRISSVAPGEVELLDHRWTARPEAEVINYPCGTYRY